MEAAMHFRIKGLDPKPFAPLFDLDDAALAKRRALRTVADSKPGFPCRISLADAEPGRAVLLLNYEHLPVESPYRASHAIYVSQGARPFDAVDSVPPALRERFLSLRAFDATGMMVDADVTEGLNAEALIDKLLANPRVEYLHAHFARRGCFAATVQRA
jgi:hypothetical protein